MGKKLTWKGSVIFSSEPTNPKFCGSLNLLDWPDRNFQIPLVLFMISVKIIAGKSLKFHFIGEMWIFYHCHCRFLKHILRYNISGQKKSWNSDLTIWFQLGFFIETSFLKRDVLHQILPILQKSWKDPENRIFHFFSPSCCCCHWWFRNWVLPIICLRLLSASFPWVNFLFQKHKMTSMS